MTDTLPWLAPYRDKPLDAEIMIPGSKSLTNRALILASLADGPSVLGRPLSSRDTNLMAAALDALGTEIERDGMRCMVTPSATQSANSVTVDCGLAGTVMRFVPPVAALAGANVHFDGDEHARRRPMSTIIESLRDLGATIDDGGRGALPFTIRDSTRVQGGRVEIDASASSQFVSALLLAGARYRLGIEVVHRGAPVPSMPHIEMTVTELRKRGVDVDDSVPDRWMVAPGGIRPLDVMIEPDLSNAGPFIAAALVTGGQVRIPNWPEKSDQPGTQWKMIAEAFGAHVTSDEFDMVFTAGDRLQPVELDLHEVGELTPVIAAVAALAGGTSKLTGIAHLRGHETDRLAALATEINKLGGRVTELDDGLEIEARAMTGGLFCTYDDHRMAHAGVVLGLRVRELYVENVATTVKTYPNFAPVWERLMTASA